MKKLIIVLTIMTFCISGCLSQSRAYRSSYNFSSIGKIAIVAVEGEITNTTAKDQVSDLFAYELLRKGYSPIMPAQIRANTEIQEALVKLPPGAYLEMGKLLKVPAVLVINVPFFNDEIFITAHLFDAQDGSILWMEKGSGKNVKRAEIQSLYGGYYDQQEYISNPLLMFQEPPQPEMIAIPGERALSPLELEKIESIVVKMFNSLPSAISEETTKTTRTRIRTSSGDW